MSHCDGGKVGGRCGYIHRHERKLVPTDPLKEPPSVSCHFTLKEMQTCMNADPCRSLTGCCLATNSTFIFVIANFRFHSHLPKKRDDDRGWVERRWKGFLKRAMEGRREWQQEGRTSRIGSFDLKMEETQWKMMATVALVSAFLLPAVIVCIAIFSIWDINPASTTVSASLTD